MIGTPVLMGNGLGADSAAIITRWDQEPETMDFPLTDLVIATAMLGREFRDTLDLTTRFILPILRRRRIRYMQIARAGAATADGIRILSDTRQPTHLHAAGAYRLEDELLTNGTLPTFGGKAGHRCSQRHKGEPMDALRAALFPARLVRTVTGYSAEETTRIAKDLTYDGPLRAAYHPLASWGWDRPACVAYLRAVHGVDWPRSACSYCPYSGGKPEVIERYRRFPEAAAHALYMEFVARALNDRMTLFSGRSLRSVLEADGNDSALRLLDLQLAATEWAVYRVRRVYHAPARADRQVVRVETGTRPACTRALHARAARAGGEAVATEGGSLAFWTLRRQSAVGPEEAYVLAPAVVRDKARRSFDRTWCRATTPDLFARAV